MTLVWNGYIDLPAIWSYLLNVAAQKVAIVFFPPEQNEGNEA
jgi:hypothetical protein